MSQYPFQSRPYFVWRIDRWKVGVVALLFLLLLITAVRWLGDDDDTTSPETIDESASAVEGAGSPLERPAETPRLLPITLANLAPNETALAPVDSLHGTASGAQRVQLSALRVARMPGGGSAAEELELGVAQADALGVWQLSLERPLSSGQYMLELRAADQAGQAESNAWPVVFTVPASSAALSRRHAAPTIYLPSTAARLPSRALTFAGTALPGVRVRLYVNNHVLGEAIAAIQRQWQISMATPLAPGLYLARATTLNPAGEISAESAPVAFSVDGAAAGESLADWLDAPPVPLQLATCPGASAGANPSHLTGMASPHSGVGLWSGEKPLQLANVRIDSCWSLPLPSDAVERGEGLVVRTSLGEAWPVQLPLQ